MKLWIIQEIAYDYDDCFHYRCCPENVESVGQPVKAFKNKKNAVAECEEMNRKAAKETELRFEDDEKRDLYEVVSVEVADEDAISYKDARDRVKAAREEARKAAKAAFEAGAKEVFDAHPELKSFGWRQYTDYFNDGEPCTFGVNAYYPDINGISEDDDEEKEKESELTSDQMKRLREAVRVFIEQFDEEDMEASFGDHKRITVTRKGSKVKIDVEDYEDHD